MTNPKYENIGSIEDKLIEECAELIQAICKAKRFGWESYHPDRPGSTNRIDMELEMQDVMKWYTALERKLG